MFYSVKHFVEKCHINQVVWLIDLLKVPPPAWMPVYLCSRPAWPNLEVLPPVVGNKRKSWIIALLTSRQTTRHSGVLCQAGQNTTRFHGHYSPWKQCERHSRTNAMLTLSLCSDGGSKTISYFRAKSLTKIHFSTPLKKIRNKREAGGRRGWWSAKLKSNKQRRASLLSWIYLCILSLFLIYSPKNLLYNSSLFTTRIVVSSSPVVLGRIAWKRAMNEPAVATTAACIRC